MLIHYNEIKTTFGWSGGPVYLIRDSAYYLIGIHCGFDPDGGAYFATGINNKTLEWIKKMSEIRKMKDKRSVDLSYKFK